MKYDLKSVSQVSKAWEENIGAQNLGNSKGSLMSSRETHIGITYHWFISKIVPNKIETHRIDKKA